MTRNISSKKVLNKEDIHQGLVRTGLNRGNVVLVHSAMRTFGYIQDGANAVIDAFLDILGPSGTLVVPNFTFAHEAKQDPLIDPENDPSEMGIISETVRLRTQSVRSVAFRHSFSAMGPRAHVITQIDPSLAVYDLRSSFGVMLALDTQIVMLGLAYASSTSHHFAEWICEVPYRQTIPLNVRVRQPDGTIVRQPMIDYQPKPGVGGAYSERSTDFNRLGRMMEENGSVGITAIGNAVVRRFSMRELVDLAQVEAAKDYNIFRVEDGHSSDYFTPLNFGKIVLSPPMSDGAGRPDQYLWSVVDEDSLKNTLTGTHRE